VTPTLFLNGRFVRPEQAVISVEDRGFVFGDALYEVVKCYSGRPFRLHDHLERLEKGAAAIRLVIPMTPLEMEDVIDQLVATNGFRGSDAIVFIQVSRGPGPRDHFFPPREETECTIVISATAAPALDLVRYDRGIAAITVPDKRWGMCNIKSVGLLMNVLAKQKARDAGAQDAIFVRNDILVEGASANFFAVLNGQLITHPEGPRILSGVTRRVVLEIAEERNYTVRLEGPSISRLEHFDEAFLTGTGTEILPVVAIDGVQIGSGRKGSVTNTIQDEFHSLTRGQSRELHGSEAY
jgi:D-alanine transaminase